MHQRGLSRPAYKYTRKAPLINLTAALVLTKIDSKGYRIPNAPPCSVHVCVGCGKAYSTLFASEIESG
jgi:hypothetical protein